MNVKLPMSDEQFRRFIKENTPNHGDSYMRPWVEVDLKREFEVRFYAEWLLRTKTQARP